MRTAKNDVMKRTYEKQVETGANELEALEQQSIVGVDLNVPYRTALEKSLKLLKNPYSIWGKIGHIGQAKTLLLRFRAKIAIQ